MAELKFSGLVIKVYPVQQVSANLSKRLLVIENDDKPDYKQIGVFNFLKDRTSLLDPLNVGDRVTVDFNITGRSYADKTTGELKYFTELQGWKINIDNKAPHNQGMGGYTNAPTVPPAGDDSDPF